MSKLFTVNASRGSVPPIQVDVEIDNHPLRMEVDTGVAYSLISESTYNELWPTRALIKSDIRLCTYSGEAMQVLGCCQVNVHYQSQASQKSLLIVGGAGPNLMGRNWLKNIRLDWSQINHVESSALKSLLYKHEAVFQGGLGELKGYQARILVNADAKPHFCKAQSVPYAYRELVEKELDCLVAEKILEPVQYAEWASPIVPVLKVDKTIRVCGDFKQTINPVSPLDSHPIPKVEDLFASFAGGEFFPKSTSVKLTSKSHWTKNQRNMS